MNSMRGSEKGFTLIEFLLFAAIFSVSIVAFTTILLVVLRIQSRQNAASEVNQQSQFLIQAIQRYVEESVAIADNDADTSTLILRMANPNDDEMKICLGGISGCTASADTSVSTLYVKRGNVPHEPLTSSKVKIGSISFVKRVNGVGHDTVQIKFTMEFATENPQQKFSRTIHTAIARSSPALVSGDIIPTILGHDTYKLGSVSAWWRSVNNTLFFNVPSGTIGIGTQNPTQALEVNGGLLLRPENQPFPCNDSPQHVNNRGALYVRDGGVGADELWACLKNGSNDNGWVQIYP